MIINLPNPEELQDVSLRLLFKAWALTVSIITEWDSFYRYRTGPNFLTDDFDKKRELTTADLEELEEAKRIYLKAAQNDLQSIYTLIQQSQEIGLKARICKISPYLLIKNRKKTPESANKPNDFLDMPTIDASELLEIHDFYSHEKISNKFSKIYHDIRRKRNTIYHIGLYNHEIDPKKLIHVILTQYQEIYDNRNWWSDRYMFATSHRWSELTGGGDWNELTDIIQEFMGIQNHLTNQQFKIIMGFNKKDIRYICYRCVSNACLDEFSLSFPDFPTAKVVENTKTVSCVVCEDTSEFFDENCQAPGCTCTIKSNEFSYVGHCMKCGVNDKELQAQLLSEKNQDSHVLRWHDKNDMDELNKLG